MTPIQQQQPLQQQTTPQAHGPQYPVLRLPSPAANPMVQGSQAPLGRCVSAPGQIDYNLNTPHVPTPPSVGPFQPISQNLSQNSLDQSLTAPPSNEALNQFSKNMEEELSASQGSRNQDLPDIKTVSSITRVSALKIKSEKRAESGQRIATKAVTKAAADAEDDSDSNADSEDDKM